MKNSLKYLMALSVTMLLGSCGKDFLDIAPQDKLTADNYYRNEAEVKAATASLYGFPWFGFNDKFFWLAGDMLSGNMYYTYDQEGQFFYFTFTEGNAHISGGWKSLFRVVSYANSIINDMPIAAAGNVDQGVIDRALGEARFIRGTAYYFLTELWGEVPIVENSTELVTSNNTMLKKNTRSSLYEFIRRDFQYAADNLPTTDAAGRINKWSAKGMLAKLYLTMAQNLSDPKSAEYFGKARELAADVINNSGASLMPNYADLFKIENNNNSESMFAFQFMEGAYGIGNSHQANWARSSVITGNTECWGGGKCASYDFTQTIENGDLRRKSIYMTKDDLYPEISKAQGGYLYKLVNRDPNDPNITLEGATAVLNSVKKYVVGSAEDTNGKVSTGQATAINQYILRLADVYLIYAEAALGNSTSTSDGDALTYFNAIRKRANLVSKGSITFDDILKERRVEFCFESLYWFDIKRFYYRDPQGALSYLNSQRRGDTYRRLSGDNVPDENLFEGYELIAPDVPVVVAESQMFLPIPAAEVVANPLLLEQAVEYIFK
ncbi:MAG: RagB/SusD family nutrient uptake outer membrane protein [Bacteroidia bacterium]|nr:RagB/SusD family nutrient uptake outer membrane protein [Bacteroidia bacterium]